MANVTVCWVSAFSWGRGEALPVITQGRAYANHMQITALPTCKQCAGLEVRAAGTQHPAGEPRR